MHCRDAVGQDTAGQPEPVGAADRAPVDPVVLDGLAAADRGHRGDGADDVVGQPRDRVAEDQGQEDGDPRPEAREQHGRGDHHRRGEQRDPLVLRPVDAGHHGGQVETDQHDHGTGDGGREDALEPPGTRDVDHDADQGQHQAGHHDRAGHVGGVAALGADRGDRGDEGRAGAEVAGHPVVDDQQEQDRADAREEDREVGVQAHHDREDEGRPEHRHHVLGTEPDGARPAQPLERSDRLAGRWCLAAVDDLPLEHAHLSGSLRSSETVQETLVSRLTLEHGRLLPSGCRQGWHSLCAVPQVRSWRTCNATAMSRRRCGSVVNGPRIRSSLLTR